MRLKYLALASLLVMGACDSETTNPILPTGEPRLANGAPEWSLYNGQTPTEILDAAPGWEVGTGFTSSKAGRIIGFRFYRAPGETGTNYGRLWNSSGAKLKTSNPFPSGTGWVTVMLDNPVTIAANETYRVSVNTNSKQAKTGGGYAFNGHLSSGPLYSSTGYYGQPTGSRPTSSSASYFFVDVIFEEFVAKPNLIVERIQAALINTSTGQEIVLARICNIGNANAGASRTRMQWFVAPLPSGQGWVQRDEVYATPAIPAGGCTDHPIPTSTWAGACHQFHVTADYFNEVPESNENDNYRYLSYCRYS